MVWNEAARGRDTTGSRFGCRQVTFVLDAFLETTAGHGCDTHQHDSLEACPGTMVLAARRAGGCLTVSV